MCVGRGLMTMGTLSLLPLLADILPIPTLTLSGRLPPRNNIVTLEPHLALPEMTLCKCQCQCHGASVSQCQWLIRLTFCVGFVLIESCAYILSMNL